MITQFMDMHSGGGVKEKPYEYIYIEAPENEAKSVFYARFGHSPDRISCTCCGNDYSISEYGTLEEATEYNRETSEYPGSVTDLGRFVTKPLSGYLAQEDVLLIPAEDIKEHERNTRVSREGWTWV